MDDPIEEELQEQPTAFEPDRLTSCVRFVLASASAEARLRGDSYVSTDQVLLSLASTSEGAAQRALDSLGLSFDLLSERMRFIRGDAPGGGASNGEPGLTPRLERVLELATKDATKRQHAEIGTLHVLSGLLRERAGLAAFLLEVPGVGLERAGVAINAAHREGWHDTDPS